MLWNLFWPFEKMTNQLTNSEPVGVSPATRFLVRYGAILMMLFMLGGLFFLFRIESTFNGGFNFSAKILAAPVALGLFGFTYFNRRYLASFHPGKPWVPWLITTLSYPMCILFGWPWVMAVNAINFEDHTIAFEGPVVAKFTSGTGSTPEIRIRDVSSNELVELNISRATYSDLKVGSEYKECFRRGSLGIPYRWKDSSQAVSCDSK